MARRFISMIGPLPRVFPCPVVSPTSCCCQAGMCCSLESQHPDKASADVTPTTRAFFGVGNCLLPQLPVSCLPQTTAMRWSSRAKDGMFFHSRTAASRPTHSCRQMPNPSLWPHPETGFIFPGATAFSPFRSVRDFHLPECLRRRFLTRWLPPQTIWQDLLTVSSGFRSMVVNL